MGTHQDSARNLIADRKTTVDQDNQLMTGHNKKKPTYLIPQPQLFFTQLHAAPKTLCHTKPILTQLTRKLKAHTPKLRTAFVVDPQTVRQLGHDVIKVSGFKTGR